MRLLLTLLISGSLYAQQEVQGPPLWAIQGIAWQETRSYWDAEGVFHYVDKRVGAAGERTAFQLIPSAYAIIRRPGDSLQRAEKDCAYACELACRYLTWLYRRTGSWDGAVSAYNAGISGMGTRIGIQYLQAVRLAGLQRIYSQGEVSQ